MTADIRGIPDNAFVVGVSQYMFVQEDVFYGYSRGCPVFDDTAQLGYAYYNGKLDI